MNIAVVRIHYLFQIQRFVRDIYKRMCIIISFIKGCNAFDRNIRTNHRIDQYPPGMAPPHRYKSQIGEAFCSCSHQSLPDFIQMLVGENLIIGEIITTITEMSICCRLLAGTGRSGNPHNSNLFR